MRQLSDTAAIWFISPLVIYLLDRSTSARPLLEKISHEDRDFIRNIARKTWRYFDTLSDSDTNWLPPDNFQSSLVVEVAERTSPTNIGLYLLSILGAYDFRYLTSDAILDRIGNTFDTFKKLEMFEGHFFNWYETKSLKPLYPRYVSTVDSGNFWPASGRLSRGSTTCSPSLYYPPDILSGIRDCLNPDAGKVRNRSGAEQIPRLSAHYQVHPKGLPGRSMAIQEANGGSTPLPPPKMSTIPVTATGCKRSRKSCAVG